MKDARILPGEERMVKEYTWTAVCLPEHLAQVDQAFRRHAIQGAKDIYHNDGNRHEAYFTRAVENKTVDLFRSGADVSDSEFNSQAVTSMEYTFGLMAKDLETTAWHFSEWMMWFERVMQAYFNIHVVTESFSDLPREAKFEELIPGRCR